MEKKITININYNSYDDMKIKIIDNRLYCLEFKNVVYLVLDKEKNNYFINRKLYNDKDCFNSKALFNKVKKFFRYYLEKTLINKQDFINFINQCNNYN